MSLDQYPTKTFNEWFGIYRIFGRETVANIGTIGYTHETDPEFLQEYCVKPDGPNKPFGVIINVRPPRLVDDIDPKTGRGNVNRFAVNFPSVGFHAARILIVIEPEIDPQEAINSIYTQAHDREFYTNISVIKISPEPTSSDEIVAQNPAESVGERPSFQRFHVQYEINQELDDPDDDLNDETINAFNALEQLLRDHPAPGNDNSSLDASPVDGPLLEEEMWITQRVGNKIVGVAAPLPRNTVDPEFLIQLIQR